MAYSIYSKAGTDEAISSALADSLPTITVDDTPAAPAEGESASYFVTSAVVWPAGLVWSTDPDGGAAPTITGTALVSLFTLGGVTRAILGATFPALPDTVAPVWSATLTTGTPTDTSVVVAASALATDAVGVTSYEYSLNSGGSWAAVTPSGLNFTLTGLTAATAYPAPQFRAKDAAGNTSAPLTAQAFTTAPSAVASVTYLSNAQDLTLQTTYTFAAQPLGATDPARTIVVAACGFNTSSANGVSAVTIGGVAATIDAQHSVTAGNFIAIAHAAVPAGSTGDVVVYVPSAGNRCAVALWRTVGGLSVADFDANDTATATVTAPAGGMVVAAGYSVSAGAPADRLWTGIAEDFDTALETRPFTGGSLSATPAGDVAAAWNAPADINRRTAAVAYSVA